MPSDPQSAGQDADGFGTRYRVIFLSLCVVIGAFAYVDRVILQTLAEPIKHDLGLSDFQIGILGGLGFALLYSTLGLPIARMAERRDRVTIISVSVAIFSVMAAACGIAANFGQIFIARIGVGIGEAGVQSPMTSLIGDHFPPRRRGFAITVMRLGAPLGTVIGSLGGAWLASVYGWRVALVAIAVPGLVTAALFRLLLRDPPRGMSDPPELRAAAAQPAPLASVVRLLFLKPAFAHLLAGLALTSMALYATGAFMSPFFMRVHGADLARAGLYLAIVSGSASVAGMSLGGFGIDFIVRRGDHWYGLLPAIGLAAATPLYAMGFLAESETASVTLIAVGGIFLFFHSVPTLVAFQNMVAANMRATAAFIYFFVSTLVGVGLGPPLLGYVSDAAAAHILGGASGVICPSFSPSPECSAAAATGLQTALLAATGLMAWAALHYYFAARHICNEERLTADDGKRLPST